jgi:hypothetical protein
MRPKLAVFGALCAAIAAPARYGPTIIAATQGAAGVLYGPSQFRELILEVVLTSPDLAEILTITDDIKAQTDILFGKRFSKVTKLDIGCGSVPGTPGMNVEKLTWNPVPLEAWIKECGPDFEDTFLAWGLGVGYKRPDLREAVIKIQNGLGSADVQTLNYWNEFMQDMMEQAIRDDIFRIGFFGDPAITAAQLTGGSADVANYNQLRGLWPQIIALATTCPAVRAATIAANQSADQLLPDGEATKVFTKRFGHTAKTTIYPGLLPVKAGNKSTVNIFPGHGHHHHGRQEGRRRHS